MDNYKKWLKTIISSNTTDGGGPIFVPTFYDILKNTKVDTLFEWCAGPAWIGIYLLERGVCKNLVLADINSLAMDEAYKTLESKGLLDKCRLYVSENLDHIDKDERFDLVVANPPNYCNIRPDHPFGHMRDDISPCDKDWALHADFYSKIGKFLNKGAKMYISEAEPEAVTIYLGRSNIPFDERLFKPIEVFSEMIETSGLKLNRVIKRDFRHNLDIKYMLDRKYPIPMMDENKRILTNSSVLEISA